MENLLLDTIGGLMKGNTLSTLTTLIGAGSEDATKKGIVTGSSALMSSLAQIASTTPGALGLQQLMSGIDPGIIDNVAGYLQNPAAAKGAELLQHFLGGNTSDVITKIAKASGLGGDATSRLLPILTPLVIGAANKVIKGQGLGAADLGKFFNDQSGFMKTLSPGLMGFLERIDANDDGNVIDDIGRVVDRIFGGKK